MNWLCFFGFVARPGVNWLCFWFVVSCALQLEETCLHKAASGGHNDVVTYCINEHNMRSLMDARNYQVRFAFLLLALTRLD